jgi:hypothetical protein
MAFLSTHASELNGLVDASQDVGPAANSDEALIARVAKGDRQALKLLYGRHHVKVYRFALRLMNDEAAAEDVVSDVFLAVWRRAGRFEGRAQVSTWLSPSLVTRCSRACAPAPTTRWTTRSPSRSKIRRTIPK